MADIRLKIISDGTANGTRIVDAETGVEVRGIYAVSWSAAVGDEQFADATFRVVKAPVELEAVNPVQEAIAGVRLRKQPDGHWIPDTPGEWDYTPRDRETPTRLTVYQYKGGLNARFPSGREWPVRIVGPDTWEWVMPVTATD